MGSSVFPQHPSFLEESGPLIQLMQLLNAQNTNQANALIAAHPKGSTVAQIGLTPKQQKAKFGKVLQPTDVVEQPSAEDMLNQKAVDFIKGADPQTLDMLTASYLSRTQGVPQITSSTGLRSQSQASETKAGTDVVNAKSDQALAVQRHALIGKALTSLQSWDPAQQTQLAEKTAFGTTQQDLQNEGLANQVKAEVQRSILTAAADPKSDLNVALKQYTGVGLGGAMAAAGLGLTSLLNNIADLNVRLLAAGAESRSAMDQADAQWAADVAKSLGGTASPRAILNWKRWSENGADPKKLPQGVSPALVSVLENAKDAGYRAYVTDAVEKGDIEAKTMMTLIQAATRVGDENTLKAIGDLAKRYMARIIMNSRVGTRPADPAGAQQWDNMAANIAGQMPGFTPHTFFGFKLGVDMAAPTAPSLTAPAASTAQPSAPKSGQPLSQEDLQNLQQIMQVYQMILNGQSGNAKPVVPVPGGQPLLTPATAPQP